MAKFCRCIIPEVNFDGTCKTCSRVLTWEQSKSSESEKIFESEPNSSDEELIAQPAPWKPISKIPTIAEQILLGESATKRTLKYATLFENIGSVMQVLNTIGAIILFFVGFFISGPGWMKIVFWVAILIIWAYSYVQTSLMRGLASYFQMRASDHIIRHWKA